MYFSQPSITSLEEKYVLDSMHNNIISGDGRYTKRVYSQFEEMFGIKNMLLTTSGTAALEMTALLMDIREGDEIIAPSFTFSSTINAFLLRGAKPVFCDIRQDTFNMDENLIEGLITPKTKAIYCVDYAGVPCDMDRINEIADKHGLFVVEDSAQAVGSKYKGKYAGTLCEFGCYSFHETKNYTMGEGGAIILNEEKYLERAEMIREKGTNRSNQIRGVVDKYTWHDIGSSYLPSDILAAMLSAQLERFGEITENRLKVWDTYHKYFEDEEKHGRLRRPVIPDYAEHTAHMYNIVMPDEASKIALSEELKKYKIPAYICYVPLHSSPMGKKLGYKAEDCPVTEDLASRILRLPIFAEITEDQAENVAETICKVIKSI